MEIHQLANLIKQGKVVAYPTESVFGLGCDPNNESAVMQLLSLKQREVNKGLIVIAPTLDLLLPFIDSTKLTDTHRQRLQKKYSRPTTWVVPAHPQVPYFLTGQFDSIAVRLCDHPIVTALCQHAKTAITSTSANLSGYPPCRTTEEVLVQFGEDFPVSTGIVGGVEQPSQIKDIFTEQIFR